LFQHLLKNNPSFPQSSFSQSLKTLKNLVNLISLSVFKLTHNFYIDWYVIHSSIKLDICRSSVSRLVMMGPTLELAGSSTASRYWYPAEGSSTCLRAAGGSRATNMTVSWKWNWSLQTCPLWKKVSTSCCFIYFNDKA